MEYMKAGNAGLDVCLISVLRWLHPSWEGRGRARGAPTEGVCSEFLQKEASLYFSPLDLVPTTEQNTTSEL